MYSTECSSCYVSFVFACRAIKQNVSPEVCILGGMASKHLNPVDAEALLMFVSARGLDVLHGHAHVAVYRIEVRGHTYYSRMYKRVKKRNSYTVLFNSDGVTKYGLIEFFLYIACKVVVVLKPLVPMQISLKEHFNLTTTALDCQPFIIPVNIENTVGFCFAEDILCKCIFLNFNSVCYVVRFHSAITMYD